MAHAFIGMDIHQALAAAHAAGDQVRVLSNHGVPHHYAESPEPGHILVEVRDGVITSARVA